MKCFGRVILVGAALGAGSLLQGQDSGPLQQPPAASGSRERPGLFHIGPFYVTPRLRIGTIGLDTNVFYTATDRRTDVSASGGPGLDLVLPVKRSVLFTATAGIDYLYFLRTTSQRRLTGGGGVRGEWFGARSSLGVGRSYSRSFARPNLEVDRRISQEQWQTRADFRLRVGQRFGFATEASATRFEVDAGQTFLGADLQRNLSRDTYRGFAEISYRLTPKTSLLIEGDHQLDRFLLDPLRDADSNRVGAGVGVASQTLLSGRAVAGIRSFRPRRPTAGGNVFGYYALADLTYHAGPRTRLGGAYTRDRYFSAFSPLGKTPTICIEGYRLRLEKGLIGQVDLRLWGGLTRLGSDGEVTIEPRPGERTVAVRDDTAWEAGADLGYVFRSRLRVGVAAGYTERRSTIADFGIRGLLVGATVTYTP